MTVYIPVKLLLRILLAARHCGHQGASQGVNLSDANPHNTTSTSIVLPSVTALTGNPASSLDASRRFRPQQQPARLCVEQQQLASAYHVPRQCLRFRPRGIPCLRGSDGDSSDDVCDANDASGGEVRMGERIGGAVE